MILSCGDQICQGEMLKKLALMQKRKAIWKRDEAIWKRDEAHRDIVMAFCCQGCNKLAEQEYWSRGSKHQFFKIMLNDFQHQLRIPRTFVERFNDNVSGLYNLKGPSGNKWVVHLKNTHKDTFFSDGWDKFVKDHGVKAGHLLVFCYDGDSEFKVTIFNSTSCEDEASHFVKNTKSSNMACASVLHGIVSYESDSDEDDDDYVPDSSLEEESDIYEDDDDDDDDNNDDNGDGDNDVDVDDDSDGDDDNGNHDRDCEEEEEEEEEEEDMFCDRKGKRVRGQRSRTSSLVKQRYRVFYNSNRRPVTGDEKGRAKQLALQYLMRNERNGPPMFQVTLLPTHVYNGFHLTIPKDWAFKHMHSESHDVELRVPGVQERWVVGCRWTRTRQCHFIPRWAKFVKDNKLEEHDVCVFELVEHWERSRNQCPLFYVHIFRVVDNPVPFTPTRRYYNQTN